MLKKRKSAATASPVEEPNRRSRSASPVDLSKMSPQSRRRYQSKLSSARLRERQRQRTANAEHDIQELEVRIQSLQYMIGFYQEQQSRQQENTHELNPSSQNTSAQHLRSEQPLVLQSRPFSHSPPQIPLPYAPRRSRPQANQAASSAADLQTNPDIRELSPESRRRYQSKLSSARLRQRQRERTATAEEEVRRLETRVQSLQNMISHVRADNHRRPIFADSPSTLTAPLAMAQPRDGGATLPAPCIGAQPVPTSPAPSSLSPASLARVTTPPPVWAQCHQNRPQDRPQHQQWQPQQHSYCPQNTGAASIHDQFYMLANKMKAGIQNMHSSASQLSLIRGRMASIVQEMRSSHGQGDAGSSANNLESGSRISISFLTRPNDKAAGG